jgi:hypothetical protein
MVTLLVAMRLGTQLVIFVLPSMSTRWSINLPPEGLPGREGLPALEAAGLALALPVSTLIFFLGPAPSDISPAVASPSLPEPAPPVFAFRLIACCCKAGVPARLSGAGFEVFFSFFRADSFPLDSESVGELARFNTLPFFAASVVVFPLPFGVLPLEDLSLSLSFSLSLSSSFSLSLSLSLSSCSSSLSSSSDESEEDYYSISYDLMEE